MLLYNGIGHGEYGIYPPVVLIHMDVLIPFYAHHRFILVDFGHSLLSDHPEHQYT